MGGQPGVAIVGLGEAGVNDLLFVCALLAVVIAD